MLSITPAAGFPPAIHANSDVTEVTVAFHSLLVVATTVQLVPPTGVEESKERNLIKFWREFKMEHFSRSRFHREYVQKYTTLKYIKNASKYMYFLCARCVFLCTI